VVWGWRFRPPAMWHCAIGRVFPRILKREVLWSFETSEITRKITQRRIPQDLNPHKYHDGYLRTRTGKPDWSSHRVIWLSYFMYKVLFNVKATALCVYLYILQQQLAFRILSSPSVKNNGVHNFFIDSKTTCVWEITVVVSCVYVWYIHETS